MGAVVRMAYEREWQLAASARAAGQVELAFHHLERARIVAATPFSRIWVPAGNASGANAPATQPMTIPPDLQAVLDADRA
ncbi:MAG: DUF3703 domain-containing protein [Steroidobacteraceae bacterium]|jgi:hypothetical protein|nr:DUF3703 domain-containing protein [Steroidobacteraceae bacterium]